MDKLFPQVLQAVSVDDYKVLAYLNDGTARCLDMRPYIDRGGIFAPLRNPALFSDALTVLNETVAWDINGNRDCSTCIDIDPFTIAQLPIITDDKE